ncbi:MAG: hypothetical protein U5L96_09320 [Owenweeksia sp.]|nr:hypothetical protein [Owenweeksia sp.]
MMKKLLQILFGTKQPASLTELDSLYKETVVHLAAKSQLQYCKSLIARLEYDLKNETDKTEIYKLRVIIKAAKSEIEKLNET